MELRDEINLRKEEIRYQWAGYKANSQSLNASELALLRAEAKKYGVALK